MLNPLPSALGQLESDDYLLRRLSPRLCRDRRDPGDILEDAPVLARILRHNHIGVRVGDNAEQSTQRRDTVGASKRRAPSGIGSLRNQRHNSLEPKRHPQMELPRLPLWVEVEAGLCGY